MQLPKLNFNEKFNFQLRQNKDKFFIYDLLRKRFLLLTPEEWVRQHWIHFFLKIYSQSALIVEKKIQLGKLTKRIDLLVTEKTIPKILIECKAPREKLSEKSFEQIARYNSILEAKEIIISNGLDHIHAKFSKKGYIFSDFDIFDLNCIS